MFFVFTFKFFKKLFDILKTKTLKLMTLYLSVFVVKLNQQAANFLEMKKCILKFMITMH